MKLRIGTAVALLLPTAASAADFTFAVPLHLENVPSITDAFVNCWVSRTGTFSTGIDLIGRSEVRIPITEGKFDGNVMVEVNGYGIVPSTEARSYGCSLRANGRALSGVTYGASVGNFKEAYEMSTGQTLDRLTVRAEGVLPPQPDR